MKATELIKKLQNAVTNHGDFDIKVDWSDDDECIDMTTNADYDISFEWADEVNGVSKDNHCYGGVIYVTYVGEDPVDKE